MFCVAGDTKHLHFASAAFSLSKRDTSSSRAITTTQVLSTVQPGFRTTTVWDYTLDVNQAHTARY